VFEVQGGVRAIQPILSRSQSVTLSGLQRSQRTGPGPPAPQDTHHCAGRFWRLRQVGRSAECRAWPSTRWSFCSLAFRFLPDDNPTRLNTDLDVQWLAFDEFSLAANFPVVSQNCATL